MMYVCVDKNLWDLIPSKNRKMRRIVRLMYDLDRTAFDRFEFEVQDAFHCRPDADEVSEYIVNNFKHLCTIANPRPSLHIVPDEFIEEETDED